MRFKDFYITEAVININQNELDKIIDKLDVIRNDLLNNKYKIKDQYDIEDLFNNKFKNDRISFNFEKANKNDGAKLGINKGLTARNGYVHFVLNEKFLLRLDKDLKWKKTRDEFKRDLEHELIHRVQMSRIKSPNSKELKSSHGSTGKDYYENKFEIMPFAKNAIDELRKEGYSDRRILRELRDKNSDVGYNSVSHFNYTAFADDKIRNKFLKYMYQYLNPLKQNENFWISKLSNNQLFKYEKEHPELNDKTKLAIKKEIFKRRHINL